jgi:predicted MFS family arabinose efflux permease
MMTGGFIRAALPVLSTSIIDEFDLSRSEFGLLLTLFMVALTVGASLMGRVADVVGGRRLLAFRFTIAAAGLFGVMAAPTYLAIAVAVVLTAMALAGGNPGTNKLIATHVVPGRRGTVMGVKQSGAQLGVLVAGTLLPVLAIATSWRTSLLSGVAIAAAGLTVLMAVVPPDAAPRSGEPGTIGWSTYRNVAGRVALIGLAMGAGVAAVFGFLPLYAQEAAGMSSTSAGALVSVMAAVGVLARIAWGRQSERSRHFGTPFVALALLSIAATAAIAAGEYAGSWLLWLGAAGAGASLEAWNAVGNMAVVALVEMDHTGRASGIVMTGFLAGGAVSPYLFGLAVDATSEYTPAWAMVAALFAVAAALSLRWRRTHETAYENGGE